MPSPDPMVFSTEEKTWPELLRWAATLPPDSGAAQIIARGAPIGPEFGSEAGVDDIREGDRAKAPPAAELCLATGYLDDLRKAIAPEDDLYPLACFAFEYRDWWTGAEHRAYWTAHMSLWPKSSGRGGDREALAFSVVEFGLDAVLEQGYARADLERRGILSLAKAMENELREPQLLRLPRVMTQEEFDHRPLLTGHVNIARLAGARGTKQKEISISTVMGIAAKSGG